MTIHATTLRGRYVFPGTSPPIADGTITIAEGRIVAVGGPVKGAVKDMGNVAILPGLVNAHTHLEFSDIAAPLGRQGMSLVEWIGTVIAHRRTSMPEPGMAATAIQRGLQESQRLGTTMLGEISQPSCTAACYASAIRGTRFVELIAPTEERIAAALESAQQHLAAACTTDHWSVGLSPHAPYSVHPELLRRAVALSAAHRVPVAMHLAESREEIELLRHGGGPFEPFLRSLGAWGPTVQRYARPLDYLRVLAEADRALVIHGNYLDDEEIGFLADKHARMSVVYCPRTHSWFDHVPYPLEKLLAAGALVALGTDSRASSPDLSVFAEMQAVARRHPSLDRAAILALGTISGARALGCADETGSLELGKRPDLAIVGLPDAGADDPYELLFRGAVREALIA